ncbi:MAG TPA: polyprenol monophosphomannose synthase [Candidatus Limnocylindrales bacterium]
MSILPEQRSPESAGQGPVHAASPAAEAGAAADAVSSTGAEAAAPPVEGTASPVDPVPASDAPSAAPVEASSATSSAASGYDGIWVVVPTYNEAANIEAISAAILASLPGATLLVVDDGSPDGTGDFADRLAAENPLVRVRHRTAKQGLGRAYLDGFGVALSGGAQVVVQMDADWSHDPEALASLVRPVLDGRADLVIGSRYTAGGGTENWGLMRRIISRSGSLFARTVLRLSPNDLTGGFKAWRATTLASVPADGVRAGGYVFQIEMTYRASRLGARLVEVPILFRDRIAGVSKMSRRIIFEAFFVVLSLRWDELRGRGPKRPARS